MTYTMEDFQHDYVKEHFAKLRLEERRDILQKLPSEERRALLESLSLEQRLDGLSEEDLQEYLDRLRAARAVTPRRPRRKK